MEPHSTMPVWKKAVNARSRRATRRLKTPAFAGFRAVSNSERPFDDEFFSATRVSRREPNTKNGVSRLKPRYKSRARAEPPKTHVTPLLQLASGTGLHVARARNRRPWSQEKIREFGARFLGKRGRAARRRFANGIQNDYRW